ncbi:MAG TPA: hypothetical protein VH107_11470, partial [Lacipirellulaceae bacterium]|nr:hypothetical protein [Lacipirellulaceae bacterium]
VALVFVAACKANSIPRVSVRGKVTYDGASVKRGLITFRPAAGSKGPSAGAAIDDGEFAISADKGPTAGPHDVEVKIASFAIDASKPDQPALALRGNMQFKTLSQHVEVTKGPNDFNFSFTTAPTPSRH